MDVDPLGLAQGLPLLAAVGEAPDQLLVLGVHTDHRLPVGQVDLGLLIQVAELGVPVGVLAPSKVLTVRCSR